MTANFQSGEPETGQQPSTSPRAARAVLTWAPWLLGSWALGLFFIVVAASGPGSLAGAIVFVIMGGLSLLFGLAPLLLCSSGLENRRNQPRLE